MLTDQESRKLIRCALIDQIITTANELTHWARELQRLECPTTIAAGNGAHLAAQTPSGNGQDPVDSRDLTQPEGESEE